MQPVEEQGYVIVAVNTDAVDYISCAKRLSQSIKQWNPAAKVCLVTNAEYTDSAFDYVRLLPIVESNPYAYDPYIFRLSPFRETIKLEADMIVASSIDHWWDLFRHRDVVVSLGCRDYYDIASSVRHYRKTFVENALPDVYNAITYWRRSNTAKEFFQTVHAIFQNWTEFKELIKFPDELPSTDLVYAMAVEIIGRELCTLPNSPTIVHMKKHIINSQTENWTRELVWEFNPLRINTVAQFGAFHYHVKDWQ